MLLPVTLSLLACGNVSYGDGNDTKDTSDTSGTNSGCVVRDTVTESSDSSAYAVIPVAVGKDDQAFQLIVSRDDGASVTIDYVLDPDENVALTYEDWYSSDESLTSAFYLSSSTGVLNYPIRSEEEALSKGTWLVYVGTYSDGGSPQKNKDVTAEVVTRGCQGNRATLKVVLAYAKGLDTDKDLTDAVDSAVEHWREIYDGINVDLEVSSVSTDLSATLKAPSDSTTSYSSQYDDVGDGAVVVTIGDTIGGDSSLYGQAGGIPGPFGASPIATVAVAWVTHAGQNGTFSADEIDLMGETMAHEVGHYLGLYHPVEMTYDYYDALSDTPQCSTWQTCEDKLGDNLMFPYPVCSGSTCINQDQLTDDQSVVARNWVGVK